jgi:uncharacterized protein (TIGR00730 family)
LTNSRSSSVTKTITVFGSSAPIEGSYEYRIAFECGKALAKAGFSICNGGYAGTMEACARGARESGGATIGVTVGDWSRKPNQWIQQEVKAATLIERLMKLVELGDAYVILPGGTGTLLEFAYVLEYINKELMDRKPIVLVGDFWGGVLETLRKESGSTGNLDATKLVHVVGDATELVNFLRRELKP